MKILVTGDFAPQYRLCLLIESGQYEKVFGGVKTIIKKVDYAFVNFECPVCKGDYKPIEKHGPNLKCSPKAVEALKWAGFNCATLANNHVLDYGDEGIADTIAELKINGIDYVGGGLSLQEASQTLYKMIDNKILAVINCCENEFSIAKDTALHHSVNQHVVWGGAIH